MYRRFLAGFSAVIMAASLMMSQSIAAFANEGDDQQTSVAVEVTDGSEKTVGDVETKDAEYAVNANGNSTINVEGNVDASGIYTNKETWSDTETKTGVIGVNASNESTVNVSGDVNVKNAVNAIAASLNSNVNVDGDVNSNGQFTRTSYLKDSDDLKETGNGVTAGSGSTVTIDGDVNVSESYNAVSASSKANVTVNGDVNASGHTVYTNDTTGEERIGSGTAVSVSEDASVTVKGNVTAEDGIGAVCTSNGGSALVEGNVEISGNTTWTDSNGNAQTGSTYAVSAYGYSLYNSEDKEVVGGNVEVKGDVIAKDGNDGVSASDNSTVYIGGKVDASGAYEYQDSKGTTLRSGADGIYANNSTVIVAGDVRGGSTGASVHGDSALAVGGSVVATGTDQTVWYYNEETKKYDIPKNTVLGTGIYTDGDSDILIEGDVLGVNTGISISTNNNDKSGSITVIGTIALADDHGSGLSIHNSSSKYAEEGGFDYDDLEDALDDVPKITIYAVDNSAYVSGSLSTKNPDGGNPVYNNGTYQGIMNAINYIIKQEDSSNSDYGIEVSGENVTYDEKIGYNTVNLQKAFKVAAKNLPADQTISGGDNVKVEENEDGSFTLTLMNNRGGINIKAILRPVTPSAITTPTENNAQTTQAETPVAVEVEIVEDNTAQAQQSQPQTVATAAQEALPSYADPAKAPAGSIVVTTAATATAAEKAEIAAISGNKEAQTISYDLSAVTPQQFKNSVIQNVATAPKNGAFNIKTDRVSYFDSTMIEAFAARPDIDINVVFTYGGKKLKVVIPAGYDVKKLLDSTGKVGFLRLMELLGSTELK